ncbi:hypothetical protein CHELA40_13786 [Chelatococcus asaccharovorans]|nr:hypothetical protein CHELA40_13786 [Chelatococcus asaccharovorans]CAH1675642.1 hypothetical protein CHELA17_61840 [Chelatococcus asaccharovorans]
MHLSKLNALKIKYKTYFIVIIGVPNPIAVPVSTKISTTEPVAGDGIGV